MTLRLLRPAEQELAEAVAWYGAISPDIADRFIAEVRRTRNLIVLYPRAWHSLGEGIVAAVWKNFPTASSMLLRVMTLSLLPSRICIVNLTTGGND